MVLRRCKAVCSVAVLSVLMLSLGLFVTACGERDPYQTGRAKLEAAIPMNEAFTYDHAPWKIYMLPEEVSTGWFHKTSLTYFIDAEWVGFDDATNIQFIVGDKGVREDKVISEPFKTQTGDGYGFYAPFDDMHPSNFVMNIYWDEGNNKQLHMAVTINKTLTGDTSSAKSVDNSN